jgi:hypothetical protein
MDRPSSGGDANTEKSEEVMMSGLREYNGINTRGEDNQVSTVLNQFETDKYLSGWSKSMWQVWKLWQQYGDDQTYFRVIGVKNAKPEVMSKGEASEDFDFYLTYDSINFDPEARAEKWERLLKVCQAADRDGVVNWTEFLKLALESEDPVVAEMIIMPKDAATQQIITRVQNDLSQIYGGIEKSITPGTPPQLGMQVVQQWGQQQDVQQRFNSDPAFKARAEKYMKQLQFQQMQAQNAVIGKMGA